MSQDAILNIAQYDPLVGTNQEALPAPSLFNEDIIILLVGEKRFTAHRSVLALHSPVFDVMFNHEGLLETTQRQVTIQDVDPLVFEKLLHFVYQKKVNKKVLNEMSVELWIVADKYQIDPLKQVCEQHMCPKLTDKTVVHNLLLSQHYGIHRLKPQCIDYLIDHFSAVRRRKTDWANLLASGSADLLAEVYQQMTVKHRDGELKAQRDKETIERMRAAQVSHHSIYQMEGYTCRFITKAGTFLGWLALAGASVTGIVFTILTIIDYFNASVPLGISFVALLLFFGIIYVALYLFARHR